MWVERVRNGRKEYCQNESRSFDYESGKKYCEYHAYLISIGDTDAEKNDKRKAEMMAKIAKIKAEKEAEAKKKEFNERKNAFTSPKDSSKAEEQTFTSAEMYEKMFKKNAIWRGKLTKGYKEFCKQMGLPEVSPED